MLKLCLILYSHLKSHLEETCAGNNLIPIDNIDQRLSDSNLTQGGHIKSIDVLPPVDLVILVLAVLDGGNEKGSSKKIPNHVITFILSILSFK